jgi:sulfur-oxidizing protein SoxX
MLLALSAPGANAAEPVPPGVAAFRVEGDAIRAPLAGRVGDAVRGRALVHDTGAGACILCHTTPDNPLPVAGNVGPSLAGVGARLSAGQLRLRIVDSTRLNAATAMPAYHRVDGLTRVGTAYAGRPVLSAQQVEDVVSYLQGLK